MPTVNLQTLSMSFNMVGSSAEFNGYLTPDALMTYCQTRLQGIDSQVQKAFAEQQNMNKDTSTLSDLANQLQLPDHDLKLGDKADDFKEALHDAQKMSAAADKCLDPDTKAKLQKAANAIYEKLSKVVGDKEATNNYQGAIGPGTPDSFVDTVFNKYSNTVPDEDNTMKVDAYKSATQDAVKAIQQDVSSAAELAMINLQSLMSQRQEAIQLATNLVQSLGDQCNKIADNVGK
jgi:hypothetical protein